MNELIQQLGGPLKFFTTLGVTATWILFGLSLLFLIRTILKFWVNGTFHSDKEFQCEVRRREKAEDRIAILDERYNEMWKEAVEARHDTARLREIIKEVALTNGQANSDKPRVQK